MRKKSKATITCAITGSIHTPSMSPYLPVTPDEIAALLAQEAPRVGLGTVKSPKGSGS